MNPNKNPYFFTVNLAERNRTLLVDHVDFLRSAIAHVIRDERDYERHVGYIHFNPVEHGYVDRASDWPHSSMHRYIAAGMVDRDWAAEPGADEDRPFGER